MAKRHKRLAVLLALFIVVMAFAVMVNLLNVYLWPFNPSPALQTDYSETLAIFPHDNPLYPPIVEVNITISSNGPLVEGQPLTFYTVGALSDAAYSNITQIVVGTKAMYSYPVVEDSNGIAHTSSTFLPARSTGHGTVFGPYHSTYTILATGQVSPDITIFYANGDEHVVTYGDAPVTVNPPSYLNQIELNHVNYILAVALLFFGFVEGVAITREFWEG